MQTLALIISPKKSVSLDTINLKKSNDEEVLIKWEISSVCNSERRRYSLTKSHFNKSPFIGGHEAVGTIVDETYKNKKFALLPHSNCITRNTEKCCVACRSGSENLCHFMYHAGLDKNTPSGFTQHMYVSKRQLFDVSDISDDLSPFLEPLACVMRSWDRSKINLKKDKNSIVIVGGGPIGCLHALYASQINSKNDISIIEKSLKKRVVLNDIFKNINNIKVLDNSSKKKGDVTVMSSSDSSAFYECNKRVFEGGVIILFSGFDNTDFEVSNFMPEIIHRHEFIHYSANKKYVGSSGYVRKDIENSKKLLLKCNLFNKIITGKVYGLSSKKIHNYKNEIEDYEREVLVLDIENKIENHIKIQYFNNSIE